MIMRKEKELNKNTSENINLKDKSRRGLFFVEKRSGLKNRRKTHTLLADDRRSGIADRQKKPKLK
jgi:hypothetical protein